MRYQELYHTTKQVTTYYQKVIPPKYQETRDTRTYEIPRSVHDGPKTAQDGPKRAQDGPKRAQDDAKMAQHTEVVAKEAQCQKLQKHKEH